MALGRGPIACDVLAFIQLFAVAVAVIPGSPTSLPIALEHWGEACLTHCAGLAGPCDYCGAAGGCCQRGNMSDPEICYLASMRQYPTGKDHVCVLLPAETGSAKKAEIPVPPGRGCIEDCNKSSGYCSFCGACNACCKQLGENDPPECAAVSPTLFDGENYQCVQPPLDISSSIEPLQNEGASCAKSCKSKGYCDWCGKGNVCCRRGYAEGEPVECIGIPEDTFKLNNGDWECVAPLAAQFDRFLPTSEEEEGEALSWPVYCASDCEGEHNCDTGMFCSGEQTETKQCPDFERCTSEDETVAPCVPKDCDFNQWTDWQVSGCSGLCNRTRTFTVNECNGAPCEGNVVETKACESDCAPVVNCKLSQWSEWSTCDSQDQRKRTRIVETPSRNGGRSCEGDLAWTEYCNTSSVAVDCVMGEWMEWSGCSRSCDGGQQFHVRAILTYSQLGGKSCRDEDGGSIITHWTRGCNTEPCDDHHEPVDCEMNDWSDWDLGSCEGDCGQKFRERSVRQPGAHGGRACEAPLQEALPCTAEEGEDSNAGPDCMLSDWTGWQLCSKTCGGGQSFRHREVLKYAEPGGKPCEEGLEETKPCQTQPCNMPVEDDQNSNCHVEEWTDWSGCSSECGVGFVERSRNIVAEAYGAGLGCNLPLKQVKPCPDVQECEPASCQWSDWSPWANCTKTCGRGWIRRDRKVIVPPTGGGALCEALSNTVEIGACNEDPCPAECVDGVWGDWSSWTDCTQTCGGGSQWRKRDILTQANDCGHPPEGNMTEILVCNTYRCEEDRDCELEDWGEWAVCSKSCNGLTTRKRGFKVEGSGLGAWCMEGTEQGNSLEEVKSCNIPSDDDSFQGCQAALATCGGGSRPICESQLLDSDISHAGKGSEQQLGVVGSMCSSKDDMIAGGLVLVQCAGYLEDVPLCHKRLWYKALEALENSDDCGKGCSIVPEMQAALLEWTKLAALQHPGEDCFAACNNSAGYCSWCGAGHACCRQGMASASVDPDPAECSTGVGFTAPEHHECVVTSAEMGKVPDIFLRYLPNTTELQVLTQCPCEGPGVSCELSDWSDWSECSATCHGGQTVRSRQVTQQPTAGGKACKDVLSDTTPCNEDVACNEHVTECQWGDWEDWGQCSSACSGDRVRHRQVLQQASRGAEATCEAKDSLEVAPCPPEACTTEHFCVWEDWSDWGDCAVTCGTNGTRTRTRWLELTNERPATISEIVEASRSADLKCHGHEASHKQCEDNLEPCDVCEASVDCDLYSWSEWQSPTKCTGLCERRRDIIHNKTLCGVPCVGALFETKPCADDAACADMNCQFSPWEDWDGCGPGAEGIRADQKIRTREVVRPAQEGGRPCEGLLSETMWCKVVDNSIDPCDFSDWGDWGECTESCGEAYRKRIRTFAKEARGGGAPCKGSLQEVEGCKQPDCAEGTTQDCTWATWSDWSSCTGGDTEATRHRSILTQPEGDGEPCVGRMREVQACAPSSLVDCKWKDWSDWGACGRTCQGGQQYRIREVAVHSERGGAPCEGPYREMQPCNEVPCNDHDCRVSDWSDWGGCLADAGCGEGYQTRTREVTHPAKLDGAGCSLPIVTARSCNAGDCEGSKDCQWNDWDDWGQCSLAEACGEGYRRRTRTIKQEPEAGGLACEASVMDEVLPFSDCPGSCNQDYCTDATWTDWQDWTPCSVTCGPAAYRSRNRTIATPANYCGNPPEGTASEFEKCDIEACPGATDCQFSEWSWDTEECQAPTKTDDPLCNSYRTRSRTVQTPAANGGDGCTGALQENQRCNPAPGEKPPPQCRGSPVDCSLSAWTDWSDCDNPCGEGHTRRNRQVETYPLFNGTACEPTLSQIAVCNLGKVCPEHQKVDCAWSDWRGPTCHDTPGWNLGEVNCRTYEKRGWCVDSSPVTGKSQYFGQRFNMPEENCCICGGGDYGDAGPCDTATGLQKRYRVVITEARNGGKPCEGASEIVVPCNRTCPPKVHYCSWGDWEDWSSCSAPCGPTGRVKRKRRLVLSDDPKTAVTAQRRFEAMHEFQALASSRGRVVAVSFVAGIATLVLVMGATRFLTLRIRGITWDSNRGSRDETESAELLASA